MSGKQITPKDLTIFSPVKLTLRTILDSNVALAELSKDEFPVLISYKIGKALNEFDRITNEFNKERKEVLDTFGTYNKEEKKYIYEEGKEEEATKVLEGLLEREYEIVIPLLSLEEIKGYMAKPGVMATLDWYFIA